MKKIPTIKTVMTPFPYSVEAESKVDVALEIMDAHTIHHLPVTKDGELAGIISSRDIRRRKEHDDDAALTVHDVMSTETYTVDLSDSMQKKIDESSVPLVVSIPVITKWEYAHDMTDKIENIFRRAVGYRIKLS